MKSAIANVPAHLTVGVHQPPFAAAADSAGRRVSPHLPEDKPKPVRWGEMLHIVVFAKFTDDKCKQLMAQIGSLEYGSGDSFHVIFPGYSQELMDGDNPDEAIPVPISQSKRWYFHPRRFQHHVDLFERHSKWEYKGGAQLLILDVNVPERQPSAIRGMFKNERGRFDCVISIGVEELIDKKIITSFDHLFNTIRLAMRKITQSRGQTWELSDALGLKGDKILTDVLASVFDLKWGKAALSVLSFRHFSVSDLRRKDVTPQAGDGDAPTYL